MYTDDCNEYVSITSLASTNSKQVHIHEQMEDQLPPTIYKVHKNLPSVHYEHNQWPIYTWTQPMTHLHMNTTNEPFTNKPFTHHEHKL
jgi:hypothetical protein